MKKLTILLFLLLMTCLAVARHKNDTTKQYFEAFSELQAMLNDEAPLSFKRAVFVTENAFFNNQLDYEVFNKSIQVWPVIIRR